MKTIKSISPAHKEINDLHAEILDGLRTSLTKAIRIGELLTEIKSGLEHGQWLPWLAANVQFSQWTARNYMRVYSERERLKSVTVLDLTDAYRLISTPKPDQNVRISETERAKKEQRETEIENSRQEAKHLLEIRDRRYYRADYASFEEYCIGRFGWSAEKTKLMIEIAELLQPNAE